LRLDDALIERIHQTDTLAQQVLQLASIATAPLDVDVAMRAASCTSSALSRATGLLRSGNLGRSGGVPGKTTIEVFHDRVRSTVLSTLDAPARSALHLRLATAFAEDTDPEVLALHWREAGDLKRAASYALAAAERATRALAFDQAARLYAQALEQAAGEEGRRLRVKLGDALVGAGRGADAARAYLDAAEGADAAEALTLRHRAAEQLLRSGHISEGTQELANVFGAFGMRLAGSRRGALMTLLAEFARLRLRGLRFKWRDEQDIAAEELARIDACWSGVAGLGLVDYILGNAYGVRGLRLALNAGEPYRISRALASVGLFHAASGGANIERAERLFERAAVLARKLDHPHALGILSMGRVMSSYVRGRFADGAMQSEEAEKILRERCTGVAWELANSQLYGLICSAYLGDMRKTGTRTRTVLREAASRGDLYATTNLMTRVMPHVLLAEGAPHDARRVAREAVERWPHGGHMQRYYEMLAQVYVALYLGENENALDLVTRAWKSLKSASLFRIAIIRLHMHVARARVVTAAVGAGKLEPSALTLAVSDAARVAKFDMPCAAPFALLLNAAIERVRGGVEVASSLSAQAGEEFSSAQMRLLAATARHCAAALSGDTTSMSAASDELTILGIADVESTIRMLAPGVAM